MTCDGSRRRFKKSGKKFHAVVCDHLQWFAPIHLDKKMTPRVEREDKNLILIDIMEKTDDGEDEKRRGSVHETPSCV